MPSPQKLVADQPKLHPFSGVFTSEELRSSRRRYIGRGRLKTAPLRSGVEHQPCSYALYFAKVGMREAVAKQSVFFRPIVINFRLTVLNFGQNLRPTVLNQSYLVCPGLPNQNYILRHYILLQKCSLCKTKKARGHFGSNRLHF